MHGVRSPLFAASQKAGRRRGTSTLDLSCVSRQGVPCLWKRHVATEPVALRLPDTALREPYALTATHQIFWPAQNRWHVWNPQPKPSTRRRKTNARKTYELLISFMYHGRQNYHTWPMCRLYVAAVWHSLKGGKSHLQRWKSSAANVRSFLCFFHAAALKPPQWCEYWLLKDI